MKAVASHVERQRMDSDFMSFRGKLILTSACLEMLTPKYPLTFDLGASQYGKTTQHIDYSQNLF